MPERTNIIHLFPGYRVFIYGREVTEDVSGITINWSLGRSPSSCSIVLSNERDKYTMTAADIAAMAMGGMMQGTELKPDDTIKMLPSKIREQRFRQSFGMSWSQLIANNRGVDDSLFSNPTVAQLIAQADRTEFSVTDKNSIKNDIVSQKIQVKVNGENSYDFFEGRAVFHTMDPVRVFIKEPDPDRIDSLTGDVPWFFGFTGWVSSIAKSRDPRGLRAITISCEDVLKNLRNSHIVPNTGIFDAQVLTNLIQQGRADGQNVNMSDSNAEPKLQGMMSFYGNPVANQGFEDAVQTVIFGGSGETVPAIIPSGNITKGDPRLRSDRRPARGSPAVTIPLEGVGRFNKDKMFIHVPLGNYSSELEMWQNFTTNQVQLTDTQDMAGDTNVDIAPEDNIDDTITAIGMDPFYMYPVEGTLWMLLPGEENFDAGSRVLTEKLNQYIDVNYTILDRLNLLYGIIKRVGFEIYAHPKGNIVIEFPMYDFFPTDFGSFVKDLILFDERLESEDTVDSDQNLKTLSISSLKGTRLAEPDGQDIGIPPEGYVLNRLIPRYGIRLVRDNMDEALRTSEAARAWSRIVMRLCNAKTFSMSAPMVHNPRYWLNRPFLCEGINHVGTAQVITHSIQWNGGCSTKVDMWYLRGWQGKTIDAVIDNETVKIPLYEPIGGQAGSPLNYRMLLTMG